MAGQQEAGRLAVRYGMFTLGLAVAAFGVVLTIQSGLGVSPWDAFHIGLAQTFGLTVGTWSQIVGALVVLASYLVAGIKPGVPTILNMFEFGWFLDFFLWWGVVPPARTPVLQALWFTAGLALMSVGIGMYISPRLGAGPRDSLMLALHEKGWSIQRVRICIEVAVMAAGWLLGGPVSIGTVLIAVFTGPLIQRTITWWERRMRPLYEGKPAQRASA